MTQKNSSKPRARCPVCSRVVTVSPRGGLHSHGNRMHASWEKCRKVGTKVNARQWKADEDGVLVAPEKLGDQLWDVRAVVENWAGEDLSRAAIDRLVKLLRGQWDELNQALVKERKAHRATVARVRNTQVLDADTATLLIAPVVSQAMAGYADPEQITRAVVAALIEWVEEDHEQA